MDYLNRLLECKTVFVCKDTLSLLDITRFDFNEYLEKQLYAHALSKFRYEINADIINEQSDSVGVMVITSLGNQCTVRLKSDDNKDGFLDYVIFKNDALVFPSHLFIKQLSNDDDILIKIFKIGPIKQHGSGNNKFRLSLQLIDNYEIDIYANSEQEAIDFGYNIGLVHWEHIWGNPEPDSIPQTSRMSLWNKKMIKVKK